MSSLPCRHSIIHLLSPLANFHWAPKECLASRMNTDMQAAKYGRGISLGSLAHRIFATNTRVCTEGQNIRDQGKISWRIRHLSSILNTCRKQRVKCEPGEEGPCRQYRGQREGEVDWPDTVATWTFCPHARARTSSWGWEESLKDLQQGLRKPHLEGQAS